MMDLTGKRLGKWLLDKELGRGGMGRVYLAHTEAAPEGDGSATPQKAAIKVLAAELALELGFLERFQREIAILQKLNHPHIVRLYESGCEEGLYYYAMEYLPGQNFDDLIHERGRLPWKEVLDIALQICPALKHAHDHGIIHRDLKPQNLLRAEDGTVKLTDFGIAKVFAGKQLTVTGGLVGTAEFLSPEQAAGKQVTQRSDLYSFGVLLYTLLTGRTPFQGRSTLDLVHKHRYAQFEPPQRLVPEIPYDLDKIICSLLEKDPAKRPANGMVLQRQFESFRQKVVRREQPTAVTKRAEGTQSVEGAHNLPGPATLMSQLVREELTSQKQGGPLAQFFNKPWVIVGLFVLCVSVIVWKFWFQEPTLKPGEDPALESESGQLSEVQKQYEEAKRLDRPGSRQEAKQRWRNLIDAFGGIHQDLSKAEKKCLDWAEKRLKELDSVPARDWTLVQNALARARELRDQGRRHEAEKIWKALAELYYNDPTAQHIMNEIEKDRGQKTEKERGK